MVYNNFTEATPLAMLTVGQFKEVIASAMPQQIKDLLQEQPKTEATPTYIWVGWNSGNVRSITRNRTEVKRHGTCTCRKTIWA